MVMSHCCFGWGSLMAATRISRSAFADDMPTNKTTDPDVASLLKSSTNHDGFGYRALVSSKMTRELLCRNRTRLPRTLSDPHRGSRGANAKSPGFTPGEA
jgi:hypothetical protein